MGQLVLLHVFPTPTLPVTEGPAVPISMEMPREEMQRELNKIVPPDGNIVVERNLIEGDPPYEILRAATAYHADLIVMGTHGRGGVTRFIMGSVAEAVSRKANCPVVTVRTKAGIASN
jgi:nucleotide-binding universal stress UspA family protein